MASKKKGPPIKFPDAAKRSKAEPTILCPAKRVFDLYNQAHLTAPAEKISKKVRRWFETEARSCGWSHIGWVKDTSNNYGAGCVLGVDVWKILLIVVDHHS